MSVDIQENGRAGGGGVGEPWAVEESSPNSRNSPPMPG